MATSKPHSNEETSFMDTSAISAPTLAIAHQNCYADFDHTKYPSGLQIIIEFLKSSILNKALTVHAVVSHKALTKAYSSAKYNSAKNIVEFDLETGKRTTITKTAFTKLLGLSIDPALIDPDTISSSDMIYTFNQMGHTPVLTKLSAFKKNKLPSVWSCLFTILFKCLAERQTGTDSASKQFLTLMYALFTDSPVDLGKILWTQFCESPTSAMKDLEISMGRFWSLVVDYAHRHYRIISPDPLPEEDTAKFPELQIGKLQIKSDNFYEFIGKVPTEMLIKIDSENEVRKAYEVVNPPPYLLRVISDDVKALIEKQKVASRAQDSEETESDANLRRSPGTQTPPISPHPTQTSEPMTSQPISSEPITSEPMNNPITSIPITPTIPISTSTTTTQPQNIQIPLTLPSSTPIVSYVTTSTTGHEPEQTAHSDHESTPENIEADSEFLVDPEELMPSLAPIQPQTAQNISFAPIGVDDDISDDDSTILFATKKDVKLVNSKLNVLIQKFDASTSSKPVAPSPDLKRFMEDMKTSMAEVFNSKLTEIKSSQQETNQLHQMIAQLEVKNKKVKDDLKILDLKIHDKDVEINELRVQNLDLNKRLQNIAEGKAHPLVERIEKMMDAKLENLSSSIFDKLLGRRSASRATGPSSETGGDATTTGVSQEIPVSSEVPISTQAFASSSTKIDFSSVHSILDPPPFGSHRPDKRPMISSEMDVSDLQKLQEEIRMKEAEKRNKADIDKDIEAIWPIWNKQTITQHVRNGRPAYWLVPRASFLATMMLYDSPDFPMSNKAFTYKAFVINAEKMKSIKNLDSVLINFYAEKSQPQHLVWSTSKICQLRCVGSEQWKNTLINYKFQIGRGKDKVLSDITCADLPLMNPFDWINMHQMLIQRNDSKYKHYVNHLKLMIKFYIAEIAKEDFEISQRFERTVNAPNDTNDKIKDSVRDGTILTNPWAIIYKTYEDRQLKTKIFYLNEKHLYSTSNLNQFLAKMELNPNNPKAEKKNICDMIKWVSFPLNLQNLSLNPSSSGYGRNQLHPKDIDISQARALSIANLISDDDRSIAADSWSIKSDYRSTLDDDQRHADASEALAAAKFSLTRKNLMLKNYIHASVPNYWDATYADELTNFREHGDAGEVWFGIYVMEMVASWTKGICIDISQKHLQNHHNDIDSEFSDLTGNDYSEGAINLAISLANHDGFNSTKLLVEDVLETKLDKNFELVMDKETLDIGLHQDGSIKRNMYWESMSRLMASAGVLVIKL
ncbi:hypothetical protein LXL04_037282 [Taraxacum kok-saghyz]